MLITPAQLAALQTAFKAHFQTGLGMAKPQYLEVATVIPSNTASNTYGWMGGWPGFREWIGDRQLKSLKSKAYQIANKTFESSVSVPRDDIEDDNLGIYSAMFQEMGRATQVFPDELIWPTLASGFTTECYDGQYYFDTDHPVNAEADGTGADASVSNMIVDGGYSGPAWFVMDTSRALKPLIYQDRRKPEFTRMDKATNENTFMRNEYNYGVDLRSNAGFSFWQLAMGVKAELNADNLWAAMTQMRDFTADGGRKLGVKPTVLVVPPALEKLATRILEREISTEGNTSVANELKGRLKLVVADHL